MVTAEAEAKPDLSAPPPNEWGFECIQPAAAA